MNTLVKQTLASIVTRDYRAAEVFEKFDLDFCCKGKISLEDACVKNSIDMDEILRELDIALGNNTFGNTALRFHEWSVSFLADYIENNHHQYVKNTIPRLLFYTQKIASVHGGRHPELLEIEEIFNIAAQELSSHMQKEEAMLFPYIKSLDEAVKKGLSPALAPFGSVANPIAIMETEHDEAGSLLMQIKKISNNYTPPADACNTYKVTFAELDAYEKDLHQHVHLENNILFPKAKELEYHLSKLRNQA